MTNPIKDTLMFLSIARDTICESVENTNSEHKNDLINFIQNEASDLQIMSLLTLGELPEEKHNPFMESILWGLFKDSVVENYSVLSESISEEALDDIVFEMTPTGLDGYSSARPILEFQYAQGMLDDDFLNEAEKTYIPNRTRKQKFMGAAEEFKEKMKKYGTTASDKAKSLYQKVKSGASSAQQKGLKAVKDITADVKAASLPAKVAMGAGAVAVASMLSYAAYKTYKNNFSKAARSCKNASDKAECMKKFRQGALKAQYSDLQKGMSACKKSTDPAKCQQRVKAKLAKIKSQMG